jgi:hypothetical protein
MMPLGIVAATTVGSTAVATIAAFNFNSTGLKSITVAGDSRTPVAVEFWYGRCASAGTEEADLYAGVGLSDGTTEYAVGGYSQDNQSTTVEERHGNTVAMVLPNGILTATLTSGGGGFKAGGCDLNVTAVTGTMRGVAIFYFASAAEVVVQGYTGNGAVNGIGAIDFTSAVGAVRAVSGVLLSHNSDTTDRCLSVGGGVGTTSAVTGQICTMLEADSARAGSKRGVIWQTSKIVSAYLNGVAQMDVSLDAFGGSGIDTTVSNHAGSTRYVGLLLLKFPSGTGAWAGEIAAPPSSGDWQAVAAGIGFVPDLAIGQATHTDNAAGTEVVEFGTGDEASVMALFAATSTAAHCWSERAGDGSPSPAKTMLAAQPLKWLYGGEGGSGTAYDVTVVSLTTKFLEAADAYIDTAQATARKMVGMAIG